MVIEIRDVIEVEDRRFYSDLKEEYLTYGDIPKFLTIKPGDFPTGISESIFNIAHFYKIILGLTNNMLDSFVNLIMMRKGYVDKDLIDDFPKQDMIQGNLDFYMEEVQTLMPLNDFERIELIDFVNETDSSSSKTLKKMVPKGPERLFRPSTVQSRSPSWLRNTTQEVSYVQF